MERLDQLSVDTLIITGDTDEIVATADSVRLNGELPDSTIEIIVESGHLPNEEKPLEFVEAVIKFLTK